MRKIGQVIEEINSLVKTSFIPAPQPQGQQGRQPQQGGQNNGNIQQLLQQLPPEMASQLQNLPPDQQAAALQQLMQGQGGQEGQPQDAAQGQQPEAQSQGQGAQGQQNQGSGSLDQPVTLTVRELLDLTSGGSASKASLAVKALQDQHGFKTQQMQQQNIQKQKETEQKIKQREAQMAAQQQQQTMAQGGGMMGGGIYGGQPGQQ